MILSQNTKLKCVLCGKKAIAKIWCYCDDDELPFCSEECFKFVAECMKILSEIESQ